MKSSKLVCMSKTVFYFGCIILFLMVYLIIDKLTKHLKGDCVCECPITKEVKKVKKDEKDIIVVDRPTQIIDSSDIQQYRSGPEREYNMGRGLPINVRTRGEPNEYQNIGLLKNASETNDMRPLYGRRVYRGSNLWNYYTVLNNHIQVKIPIEINTNNCVDERGCSEIMDGGKVTVNGAHYIVSLYPYSDFRYIPY
tara:strand:+ start:252 stop:839 length:588 start_codon:yes stop_codon:yes gene_type:complete